MCYTYVSLAAGNCNSVVTHQWCGTNSYQLCVQLIPCSEGDGEDITVCSLELQLVVLNPTQSSSADIHPQLNSVVLIFSHLSIKTIHKYGECGRNLKVPTISYCITGSTIQSKLCCKLLVLSITCIDGQTSFLKVIYIDRLHCHFVKNYHHSCIADGWVGVMTWCVGIG